MIKFTDIMLRMNVDSMRKCVCLAGMIFCLLSAFATNIVTYRATDDGASDGEELTMIFKHISNVDERTRISFGLTASNTPFTIYRAEWVNCDSVYRPLEPFSLIAQTDEVEGKATEWLITLEFPFRDRFAEEDVLILYTDRGVVRCPVSPWGQLKERIDILRNEYMRQVESAERLRSTVLIVVSGAVMAGFVAFVAVRRRFKKKRKETEALLMLIAERTDRNRELEEKVNSLYGSRLDTLNMLCNEYFEKKESDRMKVSLYNEVEKHILALRDSKSIAELEGIVNRYLDNIMIKVGAQLPELSRKDRNFLTYLYAGFSPRAVCIFTDIKIKNFYNRRSRLRERILGSDAPDREFFASKM